MGERNLANIGIKTLHVIEFPTGRFGYVGRVPIEIGYVDPTPEKLAAMRFGGRFGPKVRTFPTHAAACAYARDRGYEITELVAIGGA